MYQNRSEGSKYAYKANRGYNILVALFSERLIKQQILALYTAFVLRHSAIPDTRNYYITLGAEVVISSFLIKPFAETFSQSTAVWAYAGTAVIYAAIIYMMTTATCNLLYASHPEIKQLQVNLRHLQEPSVLRSIHESKVDKETVAKKRLGIILAGATVFMMGSLAVFRNFLVNEHERWLTINSPDDLIAFILPLLPVFLLFYFGKYKKAYHAYRKAKRTLARDEKKFAALEEECKENERLCMESTVKGDKLGEPVATDKETITCLERVRQEDVTSELHYSNRQSRQFCLRLLTNGEPMASVPIQAATANEVPLYGITDEEGECWFQWQSDKPYLYNIKVDNYHVQGERFDVNQICTLDYNNIAGHYKENPPEFRDLYEHEKNGRRGSSGKK